MFYCISSKFRQSVSQCISPNNTLANVSSYIVWYLSCIVTMTTDDTCEGAAPKVVLPTMSAKEEALLMQLKQRLQAVLKEDHFPNDLILWRFLTARDNNVDKV